MIEAHWATQMKRQALYRVIALLLVFIALALLVGHSFSRNAQSLLNGWLHVAVGGVAFFGTPSLR